jgi:hypothetical protein
MLTRGYVLVSQPLDSARDAVLETCEEMNVEVIDIKRSSEIGYQIEVETFNSLTNRNETMDVLTIPRFLQTSKRLHQEQFWVP